MFYIFIDTRAKTRSIGPVLTIFTANFFDLGSLPGSLLVLEMKAEKTKHEADDEDHDRRQLDQPPANCHLRPVNQSATVNHSIK